MSKNKRREQLEKFAFDTGDDLPLGELPISDVDAIGFGNLPMPGFQSQDGIVKLGAFHVSMKGLQIQGKITQSEWWAFFDGVQKIESAIQFIIGDLANYGGDEFNLNYEEIADRTGYKKETVENYASVARNVPQEVRNENLSFNHHYHVASLDSDEQKEYWLMTADKYDLSVRSFQNVIDIWKKGGDPEKYLIAPGGSNEDSSPLQDARLKMAKERTKVMKKAKSKKARKLWLTYAKEQAEEWQELVSKIAKMEEE